MSDRFLVLSHPPFSLFRGLAALCCAALALATTACVSLQPYDQATLELSEGRLLDVHGQKVHVVDQGEGPPLLLLHGFGGSTYSWRRLIPELSKEYRVVALDLNGFGFTERPEELAAYTGEGQIALARGVMEELGLPSVHLVGHSYGGALALTFAYRHPERVRSLVLLDAAAPTYLTSRRRTVVGMPGVSALFLRGLALRPSSVRRALKRSFADDSEVSAELVEEYVTRLRVDGAVRAYRGLTAPLPGLEAEEPVPFEEIRQPSLVVWGAEDHVISVEKGRSATALLPRGRFVVLPRCGHAPMEECPEPLLTEMESFLDEVSGAGDVRIGGPAS